MKEQRILCHFTFRRPEPWRSISLTNRRLHIQSPRHLHSPLLTSPWHCVPPPWALIGLPPLELKYLGNRRSKYFWMYYIYYFKLYLLWKKKAFNVSLLLRIYLPKFVQFPKNFQISFAKLRAHSHCIVCFVKCPFTHG